MSFVFNGTIVDLKLAGNQSNVWEEPEITLRVSVEGMQTNHAGLMQLIEGDSASVNEMLTDLLDAPTVKVTIEPLMGGG